MSLSDGASDDDDDDDMMPLTLQRRTRLYLRLRAHRCRAASVPAVGAEVGASLARGLNPRQALGGLPDVCNALNKQTPFHWGCDPLAQTQRSKLQHRRARINQQINKEMRMRAGAENLFRATTNNKVRETVALELSFVNSNLQLLKEELEELNSNMEVYQTDSESVNVPMIPLGLKETKEVDFTVSIQDFICEHYGEDSSLYDKEITELMELRQVHNIPSYNFIQNKQYLSASILHLFY
ncbi:hypothetical protein F2P81_005206 [Scophthalmus maximus]|uniref:REM-1 domain-containing protein n=1 Tax=Scophthalmus maximus TaxID=52904 RepID=A0A6A4TEM9_SCOMX|nr:hypothetical protein F2P81_005206 [Scophthalmus maximus]